MGEREDPPTLEELAENPDHNWWSEDTTITVSKATKRQLDAHRDGRPWNQYLEQLRREHADPLTLNSVDEIADRLESQMDTSGGIADLRNALETIEERTGRIERQLEDLQR